MPKSALAVTAIEDFDKEYTIIEKIGQGSYGAVFLAQHNKTSTYVAIKSLYTLGNKADEVASEMEILAQCDSDNIIRYYGRFVKDNYMWLVMEFCKFGSCRDIMSLTDEGFKEEEICCILSDVLRGLAYLHSNNKMHRDVKSDNILVNELGVSKLGDFGVSGNESQMKTLIGTPHFLAPEIIMNEDGFYSNKVDIWSLGIMAIELAEKFPPYANDPPMRVLFNIPNKPPPTLKQEDQWSSEFKDFIAKCLNKIPEERATAAQLLEHPFIKSVKPSGMKALVEKLTKIYQEYNDSVDGNSVPDNQNVSPPAEESSPVEDTKTNVKQAFETETQPKQEIVVVAEPKPTEILQEPKKPEYIDRVAALSSSPKRERKTNLSLKSASSVRRISVADEGETRERRRSLITKASSRFLVKQNLSNSGQTQPSLLGKTLQEIMEEENRELERKIEAEIKKRENEEKERIEAEAKKEKDSKMRRLSHFFGRLRPSPKELESKGIMEKEAEEEKASKKKKDTTTRIDTESESQPVVVIQEPKLDSPPSTMSRRDSKMPTPIEEKKQKRKSFLFKFT